VHAFVRLTPEIESLTISVRMKTTNLKVGTEGWHDARVAMSFEGSSSGFPAQVPEVAAVNKNRIRVKNTGFLRYFPESSAA
jgi:hypothetical protein